MKDNRYYKKYEDRLLISIFDKYVSENGDSLAALDIYKFNSLDGLLFKYIPEITLEKINTLQSSDSRYFDNLKERKYIKQCEPFNFRLTRLGYEEAKRLKNPIKYFAIKYWKFILGTTLTFIATMVASI